jgi:regulatory protein YycI of two-component signal transduction system YycFG
MDAKYLTDLKSHLQKLELENELRDDEISFHKRLIERNETIMKITTEQIDAVKGRIEDYESQFK